MTTPEVIVLALHCFLLAVWSCTIVAMPFGDSDPLTSLTFWNWVLVSGISMFPLFFLAIAAGLARMALATIALVFYVIALIYQAITFAYFVVIIFTCDGDVQCADNLTCDGTLTGVYSGLTIRFIMLFILSILFIILYAFGLFICKSLRDKLRIYSGNMIATAGAIAGGQEASSRLSERKQAEILARRIAKENEQTLTSNLNKRTPDEESVGYEIVSFDKNN